MTGRFSVGISLNGQIRFYSVGFFIKPTDCSLCFVVIGQTFLF